MADALGLALLMTLAAVAGMGGIHLALKVRRWSRREERRAAFTLQELREMLARQEIDEQEFRALRGQVLEAATAQQAKTGPKSSGA